MEQIAVLRAQWLAQISETIESAQRLAWQLRTDERKSRDARELYGKLEAARAELDSLRGADRLSPFELEPDWLQKLGWTSALSDPMDPSL